MLRPQKKTERYFVCESSDQDFDPATRVGKTLELTLNSVEELVPGTQVEIDFIDSPGAITSTKRQPARYFYINPRTARNRSDGSARHPWSNLPAARADILELHQQDKLLSTKQGRIEIIRLETFAATDRTRHKELYQRLAQRLLAFMTLLLVLPLAIILGYLVFRAWPALTFNFLTRNPTTDYTTIESSGGIWGPLIGTFFLVLISLLIAAPIGVLAGVYLNEYAKDNWFTRIISLAVVNLAGVPSIVHALFGVGAFVLTAGMGESMIAASCTLAVMTLPVIITSTREALAAVPMAFREACWNMGASKWQTIRTIVLPNSISGILTGVILQVSRAAGETAPILFTGAAFFLKIQDSGWGYWFPYGLRDKVLALSMHLYTMQTQAYMPSDSESEAIIYGTAVVLIGLVLAVNSASIAFRARLRSRKKW